MHVCTCTRVQFYQNPKISFHSISPSPSHSAQIFLNTCIPISKMSMSLLFHPNCPLPLHTSSHAFLCRSSRRSPRLSTVRGRPSRASTRMGLIPLLPNWTLLAGWIFGAVRFYKGFDRTSYQNSYKLPLSMAWPILFIVNGSFRKNFTRSIKSSDD